MWASTLVLFPVHILAMGGVGMKMNGGRCERIASVLNQLSWIGNMIEPGLDSDSVSATCVACFLRPWFPHLPNAE